MENGGLNKAVHGWLARAKLTQLAYLEWKTCNLWAEEWLCGSYRNRLGCVEITETVSSWSKTKSLDLSRQPKRAQTLALHACSTQT